VGSGAGAAGPAGQQHSGLVDGEQGGAGCNRSSSSSIGGVEFFRMVRLLDDDMTVE
jgi:hypothetical protein